MSSLSPKPYTAPPRQVWAWGIGAIANHILICTYGQTTAIFTIGFSLNAALVSWAIMLPRLVDGITDPLLGHLSDNTHTRWGRRKPFLVIGSILASVFLAALWWANPAWSSSAQLIYLFIFGTLFYCSWGLFSMAWTAIGYELTDDYHERSKVSAVGTLFLQIVLLGNAWIYWLALRPLFEHGVINTLHEFAAAGFHWKQLTEFFHRAFVSVNGAKTNEINGIRWISAIVGIIATTAAMIAVVVCKERFSKANPHPKRAHVPILPAIKATAKNKPFTILMVIKIFQTLGDRTAGGVLVFLGVYYVCQGNKSLAFGITGIGSLIGTLLGFSMLPLIKPISQWIGKKGGLLLTTGGSLAAAITIPFAYSPAHPYWMLLPALLSIVLIGIGNTISQAIMPDICDIDEVETGHRREGLFTAVMGFIQKIEISLCALTVGYIVDWSGVDTTVARQTPLVLHRLYWISVIPYIAFALGAFLITLKFPLTESMMKEVRAKLDARHAANAPALASMKNPAEDATTIIA